MAITDFKYQSVFLKTSSPSFLNKQLTIHRPGLSRDAEYVHRGKEEINIGGPGCKCVKKIGYLLSGQINDL